jgi:cytidyltransferase-like protein
MKKVNVFPGRFQPFHNGHLQAIKDAYEENGLPTVVMYIHNDKFDNRKPFNDEIIERELNIINQEVQLIYAYMYQITILKILKVPQILIQFLWY